MPVDAADDREEDVEEEEEREELDDEDVVDDTVEEEDLDMGPVVLSKDVVDVVLELFDTEAGAGEDFGREVFEAGVIVLAVFDDEDDDEDDERPGLASGVESGTFLLMRGFLGLRLDLLMVLGKLRR